MIGRIIMRVRAREGLHLDRVRMGDAEGRIYEIMDAPWWNLRRWFAYWRAKVKGRVEIVLHNHHGKPVYRNLRVVYVTPEKPRLPLIDGRRLRSHTVDSTVLEQHSRRLTDRDLN
jgi:hypothetical protein